MWAGISGGAPQGPVWGSPPWRSDRVARCLQQGDGGGDVVAGQCPLGGPLGRLRRRRIGQLDGEAGVEPRIGLGHLAEGGAELISDDAHGWGGAWCPISVRHYVTAYHTPPAGTAVPDLARPVALQSIWPACAGDVVAHIRTKWHTTGTPNWHTRPRSRYQLDTGCTGDCANLVCQLCATSFLCVPLRHRHKLARSTAAQRIWPNLVRLHLLVGCGTA